MSWKEGEKGDKRKRSEMVKEVDRVSTFMVTKFCWNINDDKGGETKYVQGVVEDSQPSGISTVYSAMYNDGDVGLLDPKETKEQVELYNELND